MLQDWSAAKKWTLFAVCVYGMFYGIATAVANVLATPQQAEDWQVTPTEAAYSVANSRMGNWRTIYADVANRSPAYWAASSLDPFSSCL